MVLQRPRRYTLNRSCHAILPLAPFATQIDRRRICTILLQVPSRLPCAHHSHCHHGHPSYGANGYIIPCARTSGCKIHGRPGIYAAVQRSGDDIHKGEKA